ncbi:MAG: ABC transporter permease, partial [Sedimentisphaerales bacterium]|nr:ABC transporter permease [Sedimentisphaerales bacterium]
MNKKSGLQMLQGRIFNLYQFRDLLVQLIQRDIKLKYRRSVLGYVWSVLNPLLVMAVQAVVFTEMFNRSGQIAYFPAYLIAGNILFSFMRESSTHALSSISGNASLLKKTYVPKYIFSLSKVTSDFVGLLFSFGALILVLIFTQVPFSYHVLLFIIPVIELYFFCLGLGLILAPAAVFFKDIQYIWTVITTAWMYLTPLFYSI